MTLVQGAAESATVEAPSKHLARVRTEVSDGTLTIANAQSRRWWSDLFGGGARPGAGDGDFRDLEAISASGAVKLRADRMKIDRLRVSASGATSLKISGLETNQLSVSGSGAMKMELAGRATEQKIAISGAGDYRAEDLASEDARVSVSGAGRVVVQVARTLKIGLSGAGSVEYLGNPKVTQQVSGAGRVKRRDAADALPRFAARDRRTPAFVRRVARGGGRAGRGAPAPRSMRGYRREAVRARRRTPARRLHAVPKLLTRSPRDRRNPRESLHFGVRHPSPPLTNSGFASSFDAAGFSNIGNWTPYVVRQNSAISLSFPVLRSEIVGREAQHQCPRSRH